MLVYSGAIVVLAVIGNSIANRGSCSYYGFQTDRETRYAAFVGCMVQVNGAWFPRNEIRVMQ
ncbi:hypothetical protein [Pseudomonas sp. Irchel s3f7]|uniref:hypothetical protein n=1 Tax=Pseudomonas sp. Irchel s3f7 TaxID=2009153 RepID=UPI00211487F7|nr:hypothetical protein [Pseudomonas sp. Irchel s3f7]